MTHRTPSQTITMTRSALGLSLSLALAACGGGGGGGGDSAPSSPPPSSGPTNSAPVVSAGADQAIDEGASVTLSGSATDADGDALSYSWTQTAGTGVTLSGADAASASFTAPQVDADESLTFELSVSDGTATRTDTVRVDVRDTTTAGGACSTSVCGKVQFEFVPPLSNCSRLDFSATELRPVRQATVQLLNAATDAVLDTTTTNDAGDYSFSGIADGTNVKVRVLAEMKQGGAPGWDVEIRDNVDTSASAPPLNQRPKYALENTPFTVAGNGAPVDLVAASGWGGTSYTEARAAAPFAVMDSIYNGMQLVLDVDPTVVFAPLDAYWSVNNALVVTGTDIDAGELGASFYRGDLDSLFLVGDAVNGQDTEEYDEHVIVHEWGHYFEDTLSRSDSIGGPHAIGANIDARLAFGEGWATALAAMALENPLYCDTNFSDRGGFGLGAEDGGYDSRGWYDEVTVVRILYDLFDANNEGPISATKDPLGIGDTMTLGFAPIYDIMVGPQQFTPAFTTIFSFLTELRASLTPAEASLLDDQISRFDMNPTGLDIWGTNELENREDVENSRDVLPLYTDLPTDGTPVTLCVNDDFDPRRDGNKLAGRRYLRFNVTTPAVYDVNVTVNSTSTPLPADDPADERDQSDPDVIIFRNGIVRAFGQSGVANQESFPTQTTLATGTHVMDLHEFRYRDDETPADFPSQVCFDVSMSPR